MAHAIPRNCESFERLDDLIIVKCPVCGCFMTILHILVSTAPTARKTLDVKGICQECRDSMGKTGVIRYVHIHVRPEAQARSPYEATHE